ncbi:MAG: GAF domain-containing protein [Actinomycetota bacterium]|nr:GAF domain-containing protein [Actinomycetota bacterium]
MAPGQNEPNLDEARLRRLGEAGLLLAAARDPQRVLDRLVEQACELTGAEQGSIGETGGPGSMSVPIEIGGEPWSTLTLSGKRQGEFDAADAEAAESLTAWAAVALENAWLYRNTDELRNELERSLRALEATAEIARSIGGETRIDRLLELVADRSLSLVEASGVVVMLSDGEELSIAATAGSVPRELIGARVPARRSVAGRVLASGQPERVARERQSPDFLLARHGVRPRSSLIVPLMLRGVRLGVIEAFDRAGGSDFRLEDERLLLAAAASAAGAIATAQSAERDRLRRTLAAAEQERRRWARELHDDTLQALGGLRVVLSSARRWHDVDSLHAALDRAVEQLGEEIANLRSLITELRPAALDQLGLAPALEVLCDRVREGHKLRITSAVALGKGGRRRLDPEIETVVYRVVQESLTNAVRHSLAEHVEVEVSERGDQLRIAIRDDGRGFDVGAPSDGFGLSGIRERISLAGGQLEISSSSSGTEIEAVLPSSRASHAGGDWADMPAAARHA